MSSSSSAASSSRLSTITCARQERRIELEGGVLGGRPDDHNGAVFHDGQEAVLLGAVEAVDLVHKQECALAGRAAGAGRLENLLEVGDAREDRRHRLEMKPDAVGQQARDGGLAGAGRAPEYDRGEVPGGQHAAQRPLGADQVFLADNLLQNLRAQPVGERARRPLIHPRRLEKIVHGGSLARFGAALTGRESRL